MQRLNGNRKKVMGKRCSLGLFCTVVFIAFAPAFAQIEAVSEKDKPRHQKIVTLSACAAVSVENKYRNDRLLDREQPGGNNLVRIAQVPGTNNGPKATVV